MSAELKPCPNCGSKVLAHLGTEIHCANCHLAIGTPGYPTDMGKLWNALPRRSDIERLEKEAGWLASRLDYFNGELYEDICPQYKCPHLTDKVGCVKCWREAARKAVEEK